MTRHQNETGLTLVEVLVSVMLSVIGVAGLLGSFNVMSRTNGETKLANQAVMHADSALEELRGRTAAQVEALYPSAGAISASAWAPQDFHLPDPAMVSPPVVFHREVSAALFPSSTDLVVYTVRVCWSIEGAADITDCDDAVGNQYARTIELQTVAERGTP